MRRILITFVCLSLGGGCGPADPPRGGAPREQGRKFVEATGRCVAVKRKVGKVTDSDPWQSWAGTLDARGNWIPRDKDVGALPISADDHDQCPVTNEPAQGLETEEVFEYRSGLLIEGALDRDGNFIPRRGSKIIALGDYLGTGDRRRIYNLPGRIVPAAKDARP